MRYHGAEDGFQITPRQACHRPRGVEREWIMDAKKVAVRNVMCFIHEREGGSKWMEGRMKNMAAMMDNRQSDLFFYIYFISIHCDDKCLGKNIQTGWRLHFIVLEQKLFVFRLGRSTYCFYFSLFISVSIFLFVFA